MTTSFITNSNDVTISSREISEFGNKQHYHVKRDFVSMCRELGFDASKYGCIYLDAKNREQLEYIIPKDLALTLVTGYRADLRYKVIKRVEELEGEKRVSGGPAVAASAEMREVRQVFHEGKRMATIAGFKGNQAVLSGQKLAIRLTGVDPLEIIGATHLVAPKQESLITPTDIGNRLGGYSSRAVNKLLESHGFQKQVRDLNGKSHWEMTDKGEKAGGVYLDTGKKHGDGTAVRQLKWGAGVISELQGVMCGKAA